MPYPIVNPLGSIHYISKKSVPSLYWYSGYELPCISKSRRTLGGYNWRHHGNFLNFHLKHPQIVNIEILKLCVSPFLLLRSRLYSVDQKLTLALENENHIFTGISQKIEEWLFPRLWLAAKKILIILISLAFLITTLCVPPLSKVLTEFTLTRLALTLQAVQ